MGLDNYPYTYPCKSQGTAVLVPRTDRDGNEITDPDTGEVALAISCEQTQACGGCPYKNARDKQEGLGTPVYGMLGTDCWYRGKFGNYLLSVTGIVDYDLASDADLFYGDNEDGTYKSPMSCEAVADSISEFLEENSTFVADGEDIVPDLKYAEWYLRWAAATCGGLAAWY